MSEHEHDWEWSPDAELWYCECGAKVREGDTELLQSDDDDTEPNLS